MSAFSDNMKAVRSLRAGAQALRQLPAEMGTYYANIGKGNANPPVGDRFKGKGNARFAPLSTSYALWKRGQTPALNAKQHETYGRGSKTIVVEHTHRRQGLDLHGFAKGSLPILVRTGRLRALVAYSGGHKVTVNGDTAFVAFTNLPPYAKYLHTGTSKMPKRSPVDPNADDLGRVSEFGNRWLSLRIKEGSAAALFGGGVARVI